MVNESKLDSNSTSLQLLSRRPNLRPGGHRRIHHQFGVNVEDTKGSRSPTVGVHYLHLDVKSHSSFEPFPTDFSTFTPCLDIVRC